MIRQALFYKNSENRLYTLENYFVEDNGNVYYHDKLLKEYVREGYKCVKIICNDNKERYLKIHRIVASTFFDICGNFNEVINHLDENKFNNSAFNLQWTTNKENLSWGNIENVRNNEKKHRSEIRDNIKKICIENNIKYTKCKISKLKTCYKIKLINTDIRFYTIGFSTEINLKRSIYPRLILSNSEVNSEAKIQESKIKENDIEENTTDNVQRIINMLHLFPEEIENFKVFIKLQNEIRNNL